MREHNCEIHKTPQECYIKPNGQCCQLTPGLLPYWASALYDDTHSVTGVTYSAPPPDKLFDNVSTRQRGSNRLGLSLNSDQSIYQLGSFPPTGPPHTSPDVPTIIYNIGQPLATAGSGVSLPLNTSIHSSTNPSTLSSTNQFYQPEPSSSSTFPTSQAPESQPRTEQQSTLTPLSPQQISQREKPLAMSAASFLSSLSDDDPHK